MSRASELLELHRAPGILTLTNVWDVGSARVVAGVDGTRALATASAGVATAHGYADGEQIPLELHLAAVARIVGAVDVPVSADLEAGYGDAGETARRAIALGVAGMNLEDELKPLDDAVAAVEAVVAAAQAEGVPEFVLNARTDAFLRAPQGQAPEDTLAEAILRGRAYLEAGAPCVFVPAKLDEAQVRALVEAFGPQRLAVIAVPGSLRVDALEKLGVARVTVGPWAQRVALTALRDAARALLAGGTLPANVEPVV